MALLSLPETAGSQADVAARLKALLPTGWFADSTPVLDGVLNGLAAAWQALFSTLATVQAQSRIATATDLFLDLAAQDFFAGRLVRAAGEPDSALRLRIQANLLRVRNTRAAVSDAVTTLTGRAPRITEPARIADTGAWNNSLALAWNVAGAWGSFAAPFQVFVQAFRPLGIGVARCGGYGSLIGGYGAGALQYTTTAMAASNVSDGDIDATIAACLPIATTAWVAISD